MKRHLGTDTLIDAINKQYGKLEGSFIPTKIINVVLILAAGGSAGKESPCAQIGAGCRVIFYDVLLPAFVASLTAYRVSSALGVTFFYYPLKFIPAFGQGFFLQLLAGVFFWSLVHAI